MEISYAGSKRCKVILIQTQTPKSKLQTAPFGAATKRTKTKLTQNPKNQTPKSKRPVWILDFGFGRAGTGGDGYVGNDDVWPCWPPEYGLVGGTLACNRKVAGSIPPTRGPNWAPISGGGVLPETEPRFRAPISGPVSWKSPNFRRNRGPGSPAQNVRSTSRGAGHVCKCKGCQHHVASTTCANARDVNIA